MVTCSQSHFRAQGGQCLIAFTFFSSDPTLNTPADFVSHHVCRRWLPGLSLERRLSWWSTRRASKAPRWSHLSCRPDGSESRPSHAAPTASVRGIAVPPSCCWALAAALLNPSVIISRSITFSTAAAMHAGRRDTAQHVTWGSNHVAPHAHPPSHHRALTAARHSSGGRAGSC